MFMAEFVVQFVTCRCMREVYSLIFYWSFYNK